MNSVNFDTYIQKYNTEDILSKIIEYQFSGFSNNDTDLVKLECLASKTLKKHINSSENKLTDDEFLVLLNSCQDMFTPMLDDIFKEAIKLQDASNELKATAFKSMMMKIKNTFSRGDGYLNQLISFSGL